MKIEMPDIKSKPKSSVFAVLVIGVFRKIWLMTGWQPNPKTLGRVIFTPCESKKEF